MVLTIASCTKKYVDYNTNPYQPTLEQKEPDSYISGENFPAMINAVTPAGDAAGRTDFVNSYQVAFNLAADAFSGYMGQEMNRTRNLNPKEEIEREMCPWAISKYFGDLVSNTSA